MRYYIITILLFSLTLFAEEPKADVTQSESRVYAHTSFRSLSGEFLRLNGSILDASKRGILVGTAYVIPGHEAWGGKEAFARTLKLLENIKRD